MTKVRSNISRRYSLKNTPTRTYKRGAHNLVDLDFLVLIKLLLLDSSLMVSGIGEFVLTPRIMTNQILISVVFAQLAMEHPHILLLGEL